MWSFLFSLKFSQITFHVHKTQYQYDARESVDGKPRASFLTKYLAFIRICRNVLERRNDPRLLKSYYCREAFVNLNQCSLSFVISGKFSLTKMFFTCFLFWKMKTALQGKVTLLRVTDRPNYFYRGV